MDLSGFKRIVIKVGSALLVDQRQGRIFNEWLTALAMDIGRLSKNAQVVVVSSGSIALGRSVLKLPRGALSLDQSQASAAVGQIALAKGWSDALAAQHLTAAQVLLTFGDTEVRRRYLNARATLFTLLDMKAVPVINENDTVATSEIRYGDNDRLAARVASMIEADCLILLSDIDGLYTANPQTDKNALHIATVERVTPEIEAMASGPASELSRGGMKTKIDAAKIATSAGATMIIASGKVMHPINAIEHDKCTVFKPATTPLAARKKWIAGAMAPTGGVVIDDGAVAALANGKSLLPAGVIAIEGNFAKGDVVAVRSAKGEDIARGLVAYDVADAKKIAGMKSADIEGIIVGPFREEIIHRDDLVLSHDA